MQTNNELLRFNNAIAHQTIDWWQVNHSAPGHDADEIYLKCANGTVIRIFAEHREYGAALVVNTVDSLPEGLVYNITDGARNTNEVSDGQ